ncbi:14357_t:CDS:2 [Acaulospora morrowiae]|uniref:14357_t:CDS:1 n=1 Tax=Acaulospora morrowiae TaxID=94023 RepID=A0A9N9G6B9_9GLOM|nr:14357_t:CDS:2 [Acaulospora morrowiae]
MEQEYNRNPNKKKTLPSMIKSLKKLNKKGKTYCQNAGCNKVTNEDYNYCSETCHLASNKNDGEDDLYLSEPTWSSKRSENNTYMDFYASSSPSASRDNYSYTSQSPLYSKTLYSNTQPISKLDSPRKELIEDYPIWYNSSMDTMQKSRKTDYDDDLYSFPSKASDGEIACPTCTYYVRSNQTVCDLCGSYIKKDTPKDNRIKYDDDDLYGDLPVRSHSPADDLYGTYIKKDTAKDNRSKYYDDDDLYGDLPVRSHSPAEYTKQERQQLPTPPPQTTDDSKQIPCSVCMYMNHPLMVNCEKCDEVLLNHYPEESLEDGLILAQIAAEEYEETLIEFKVLCSMCSFLNAGHAAQCEMCYAPISDRPVNEDTEMVQCTHCTYMNNSSILNCELCNEELPGAAEKKRQYEEFYNARTRMTILNPKDNEYVKVQQRFLRGIPNARIQAIIRMNMPRRLVDAHERYKQATKMTVNEMFHGTIVACNAERYYKDNNTEVNFCTVNCGLCGISQNGNLRNVSKHGGRMWFARHSSISLGYCGAVPIKAMFSVEIVANNNQDIIIVDKEEATLVKHLILYQV